MSSHKRLLIASPCKGGNVPLYYVQLQEQMILQPPDGWDVEFLCEASNAMLCISRNILANQAITKGYDAMLQLDLDHPVEAKHIYRILSHDPERYPIISALYCIKRPGKPFFLGMREKGAKEDENGLLPAAFLPTGFLLMSAHALRKIHDFHRDREVYIQDDVLLPPGVKRANATMVEMFPVGACGPRTPSARLKRVRKAMEAVMAKGPQSATRAQLLEATQGVAAALTDMGDPGYLCGEDYFGSLLARHAGVPMFIDTHLLVPHEGKICYPILDGTAVASSCDPIPEYEGNPDEW